MKPISHPFSHLLTLAISALTAAPYVIAQQQTFSVHSFTRGLDKGGWMYSITPEASLTSDAQRIHSSTLGFRKPLGFQQQWLLGTHLSWDRSAQLNRYQTGLTLELIHDKIGITGNLYLPHSYQAIGHSSTGQIRPVRSADLRFNVPLQTQNNLQAEWLIHHKGAANKLFSEARLSLEPSPGLTMSVGTGFGFHQGKNESSVSLRISSRLFSRSEASSHGRFCRGKGAVDVRAPQRSTEMMTERVQPRPQATPQPAAGRNNNQQTLATRAGNTVATIPSPGKNTASTMSTASRQQAATTQVVSLTTNNRQAAVVKPNSTSPYSPGLEPLIARLDKELRASMPHIPADRFDKGASKLSTGVLPEDVRHFLNVAWLEVRDAQDMTPLLVAARDGDLLTIYRWKWTRADFDVRDATGKTPIMHAILSRDSEASVAERIELLHKFGARLDVADKQGKRAFDYATVRGQRLIIETVQHLVPVDNSAARAPDIREVVAPFIDEADANGRTILMHVVLNNTLPGLIRFLHDKGARVNSPDHYGKTPITYARERGNKALVEVLEQLGGVELTPAQYQGLVAKYPDMFTPFDANQPPFPGPTGTEKVFKYLENEYFFGVDGLNRTLLMRAAAEGNLAVVKAVLPVYNTKLACIDAKGRTALFYAVLGKSPAIITLLHNAGALLDVTDDNGKSLWDYAVEANHRPSVELLRRLGVESLHRDQNKLRKARQAEVEMRSGKYNQTWLMGQVHDSHCSFDIMDYYYSKGMDFNLRDNRGKTALTYALEAGNQDAANLIRRYGGHE